MEDLVRSIAMALVDDPDMVDVKRIDGNQTCIIELSVAKNDLGKVIGRQGRTASAVRTILNCASAKHDKKCVLQIIED